MYKFYLQYHNKNKRKKDDSVDLFDSQTGKPYFKPKICRPPKKNVNKSNKFFIKL